MLFRASDGICLAQCKAFTVIFGEDPNQRRSRVFISPEYAKQYLRKLAEDDQRALGIEGPMILEERDGEPVITLPQGAMDIPVSGFNKRLT